MIELGSDDYNTPESVLEPVRKFGPIALDPCSNEFSTVGAAVAYDLKWKEQDGLVLSWADVGPGTVFVNPPYSNVTPWLERCDRARINADVMALLKVDTSTDWWKQYIWAADAICFIDRRVTFPIGGAKKVTANFASALVYMGPSPMRFIRIVGDALGSSVRPRKRVSLRGAYAEDGCEL